MPQSIVYSLTALFLVISGGWATAADRLTYEQHIRPILKANCFHCHGEDGTREGGLDLRLRRLIAEGGDSGSSIVPGEPDTSLLLSRVRSEEMPPDDRKKLSPEEIQLLLQWIEQGAATARDEPDAIGEEPLFTREERDFWCFQPIQRPALPEVRQSALVNSPVDAFLLARLEAEQLTYSATADRRTLLRRVCFDLLGLPPTLAQMQTFLDDGSPDAYARLVTRLLASPQHGERWARHWLDVAGYADSEGYTDEDAIRPWAFRYRDYVVRSFNEDLPFDRFIREQLAGDELVPPPHRNLTPEQADLLTASGFLRMAPDGTGSSGVDQNVARNEVIADTIKIVSTSLFGLTIGCARCHDHRYDPITQADYYRLRAVFEPAYDWKAWRTPAQRLISLYSDQDRDVARAINDQAAQIDKEREGKAQQYVERTLDEELELVPQATRDALRTAYKTAAKMRTAAQSALLKEYPSVASISVGSLYLYDRRREERARKLDDERGAKQASFVAQTRAAALAEVPELLRDDVRVAAETKASARNAVQQDLLDRFSAVAVTPETLAEFNPQAAEELGQDREKAEQLRAEKAADDLKRYSENAAQIRAKIPAEPFIRVLNELPGHVPATFVFHRGDHEQPKQEVLPGQPQILADGLKGSPPIPTNAEELPTSGRRLAFARQLLEGRHPLVARVIVNRIWLHHFGRGIVHPPGDFGMLGSRPTHPELLDWLADEFIRSGWQVKHVHRLIMTSTAYRQASQRRSDLETVDPDNQWFARMSMRRLEAEAIRDAVLSVSGRLNNKMHGPPVPVMEDEVGQIVIGQENLDGERKPTSRIPLHGEEFRRSLYVQVRRSRPLDVLEAFDSPLMTPNCEARNASTVASQSLLWMNSDFATRHGEDFASRLIAAAGNDRRAQITQGWLLAFARQPNAEELTSSEAFLDAQAAILADDGDAATPAKAQQQALAVFCQALLSSNRFLYVE